VPLARAGRRVPAELARLVRASLSVMSVISFASTLTVRRTTSWPSCPQGQDKSQLRPACCQLGYPQGTAPN
jgi:hypothetical protein